MIIGIDASKAAETNKTGVENFVYYLILNLTKIDNKNTYYLYTNKHLPQELISKDNFKEIYIPFPKLWNKFRLPLALLKFQPDVYLETSYMVPLFAPKKSIAVFHDLAWVKFPKAYSKAQIMSQEQTLSNITSRTEKIVCVSDSSKKDLDAYLPAIAHKTLVIHLAGTESLKKIDKPRDILNLNSKYFLSLGRLEERKNTLNIIKAFIQFKTNYQLHATNYRLILAGKPGYGFEVVADIIKNSKYKDDIIIPGYIANDDLNDLLSGAAALVYPSLYEGFGLPSLEAMRAGTPVITSNTSSLPEIVGDAAILVNPEKIEDIAQALEKIATDPKLRNSLIEKGLKQQTKFTWEQTAKKFLKLMEEL